MIIVVLDTLFLSIGVMAAMRVTGALRRAVSTIALSIDPHSTWSGVIENISVDSDGMMGEPDRSVSLSAIWSVAFALVNECAFQVSVAFCISNLARLLHAVCNSIWSSSIRLSMLLDDLHVV